MKTISEIQKEFHEKFPYLRIIFFPGRGREGDVLVNDLALGNFCKEWNESQILIHAFHSVKETELIFSRKLKIEVKIERMQHQGWMDTRRSYYLSLDTQNEMGRLATQVPSSDMI